MSVPATNSHLHQNPKFIHFYTASPQSKLMKPYPKPKLKGKEMQKPNFPKKIKKKNSEGKQIKPQEKWKKNKILVRY